MGSLLAYPSFINQFANTETASGERQISAPWQAALVSRNRRPPSRCEKANELAAFQVNGAYIGEILGLWLTGIACDRCKMKFLRNFP